MTYYVVVHRDEDQQALLGEDLDAMTSHMVFHTAYDLHALDNLPDWQVIWEMEKSDSAKFGYSFKRLVGIPQ